MPNRALLNGMYCLNDSRPLNFSEDKYSPGTTSVLNFARRDGPISPSFQNRDERAMPTFLLSAKKDKHFPYIFQKVA